MVMRGDDCKGRTLALDDQFGVINSALQGLLAVNTCKDPIVLLVIALLASVTQWPKWLRYIRSTNWPTILGTVESGEVSTFRGRRGVFGSVSETATATISYSYQLNGNYYSGYHEQTFNDEQKAWSYVDALKGKTVQVRFNPRKPESSILRAQQVFN
jgi:hypothetical protein